MRHNETQILYQIDTKHRQHNHLFHSICKTSHLEYYICMKKPKSYSLILSIMLFTMLGIAAFIQLRSSLTIRKIEEQRLSSRLSDDVHFLVETIKENLFFQSFLANTHRTNFADALISFDGFEYAIFQWQGRQDTPNLFDALFVYSERLNKMYKWTGASFKETSISSEKILNPITIMIRNNPNFQSQMMIELKTGQILFIEALYLAEQDSRLYILSFINKTEFAYNLLPYSTEQCVQESFDFYFRIRDTESNQIFYESDPDCPPQFFDNPDFSMAIMPENDAISMIPNQKDEPDSTTAIMQQNFSKAFYEIAEKPYQQERIVLEVIHRQGSLLKASSRNMLLSLISSLIVLLVIGVTMIIVIRNMRKAERLATHQQEFISTITHELKTPLAVISAAAQNMSDGIVTSRERICYYGNMINKESKRLKSTIEYFLLYSKINIGTNLRHERQDLCELLRDEIAHWELPWKSDDFEVEVELPSCIVPISCDKTAILSAIDNLISNAYKHSKDGKYTGISLKIENCPIKITRHTFAPQNTKQAAIVRISDHGEGIPKNEQNSIFEPFVRGQAAHNHQVEGSGVGLNLVKRIMNLHGGLVLLESTSSSGTTFALVFPILKENEYRQLDEISENK